MVFNMKINMKLFCCLFSGGLKLPDPLVISALIDDDDWGMFFKKNSYVYIKSNKQITATVLRNLIILSRKCMLLLCKTHRKYFVKTVNFPHEVLEVGYPI